MKNVKLILTTEKLGNFNFENHHNSTSDFYQAMCLFESNNWEMLGETTYTLFTKWDDGTTTETKFDGMNASANLAEYLEEEV